MSEVRVLTVRQPWAWAIIQGGKDVENRTRSLGPYRGPIAIHAGLQDASMQDLFNLTGHVPEDVEFVRGAIIGIVDLVDAHPATTVNAGSYAQPDVYENTCCRSIWGEYAGCWHLALENPRRLDQPLPWRGGLGLRKSNLHVEGDWLGHYFEPAPHSCTPYGCPPSCYSEPLARLEAVT